MSQNASVLDVSKVWLVTGSCGQDSSHFIDLLLKKGYTNIHGTMRRSATFNTANIDHVFDKINLHYADLTDAMNIHNIISIVRPDYIVNFAAQSHVKVSHDLENYTFQVNTIGVLNILQSVRSLGLTSCRIYQCGTSEEYGNTTDGNVLLDEKSDKMPVSMYGVSKLAAEHICNIYRDAYKMFVVCGTLFNHESERRGGIFVTQKIAKYVGKYAKAMKRQQCLTSPLQLGNLNARRDWGHARDYCEAIYLMLTQKSPVNYVVSTGETHSVREFVELAFAEVGVTIIWSGNGSNEIGVNQATGEIVVQVNPKYYRDIDIECLIGDSSKIRNELGWKPNVSFKDLVKCMVYACI
jgi:GDPmannose 4,6-dehydratase